MHSLEYVRTNIRLIHSALSVAMIVTFIYAGAVHRKMALSVFRFFMTDLI